MNSKSGLWLAAGIAALVFCPAATVIAHAIGADGSLWSKVVSTDLLPLARNTVVLAAASSVSALLLGGSAAVLTTRFRFPGQPLLVALVVSPLAVPPYLVAQMWMEVSGPGKPLEALLGGRIFGHIGSAAAVIGLCLAPLSFLILRAALAGLDATREEAAATLGHGPLARWFRLLLPSLRPAAFSSMALVALYACADFGAVTSLGTQTFTRAIFFEMDLNLNRDEAASTTAILAGFLLLLSAPAFFVDRWTRSDSAYEQGMGGARPVEPRSLSIAGQAAAWLLALGLAVPTSGLVLVRSLQHMASLDLQGRLWPRAFAALGQSMTWAVAAACIALASAALVAWTAARREGPLARSLVPSASLGFVLPGPVVALGLLLAVASLPTLQSLLYGSAALLVFAYVVRFLPEALQAIDAGLAQVPAPLEDAARTLGCGPLRTFWRVTLPLLRSSLFAGWILVFTAALRELPATLLLKPLGGRSLATEIWKYAEDSHYDQMAPAALLLLCLSVPSVVLLLRQDLNLHSPNNPATIPR